MVSLITVVAHLVKLVITISCMKQLGTTYCTIYTWSLRAFQIFFVHSILGVLRFGTPFFTSSATTAKGFRNFYDWFSHVVDIVPLALLSTDILRGYNINERIRLILLTLGIVPLFFQMLLKSKDSKLRKYYLLINITAALQLLAILMIGLRNGNFSVISLVVSYGFQRFFLEEFCYRYDVPYADFSQYCLSFFEVFSILTLKDI